MKSKQLCFCRFFTSFFFSLLCCINGNLHVNDYWWWIEMVHWHFNHIGFHHSMYIECGNLDGTTRLFKTSFSFYIRIICPKSCDNYERKIDFECFLTEKSWNFLLRYDNTSDFGYHSIEANFNQFFRSYNRWENESWHRK